MSILLPAGSTPLNVPSHSLMHRVVAIDSASPEQSLLVGATGATTASISLTSPILTASAANTTPKLFVYNSGVGGSSWSGGAGNSLSYIVYPSSKVFIMGAVSDITSSVSSSDAILALDSTTAYIGAYGTLNSEKLIVWGHIGMQDNGVGSAAELRLYEPSNTGSNYVGFKAPNLSANKIWTLPTADAVTLGSPLLSNASGVLSWATSYSTSASGVTTFTAASSSITPVVITGVTSQSVPSLTILAPADTAANYTGIGFGALASAYDLLLTRSGIGDMRVKSLSGDNTTFSVSNVYSGTSVRDGVTLSTTGGSNAIGTIWLGYQGSGKFQIETVNTGSVINEAGSDMDIRIEGDTEQNLLFIDAGADAIGVGTATPSARIHIMKTSEQLRVGYDVSNYLSITINATGSATLDLTGTSPEFTFSDAVNVPDEAFGSGWDGNTEVPTKNSIFDKVNSILDLVSFTYYGGF